jgi:hypothetical protein
MCFPGTNVFQWRDFSRLCYPQKPAAHKGPIRSRWCVRTSARRPCRRRYPSRGRRSEAVPVALAARTVLPILFDRIRCHPISTEWGMMFEPSSKRTGWYSLKIRSNMFMTVETRGLGRLKRRDESPSFSREKTDSVHHRRLARRLVRHVRLKRSIGFCEELLYHRFLGAVKHDAQCRFAHVQLVRQLRE